MSLCLLSRGNRSGCDVKVDFILECCHEDHYRCHNSILKMSQKIEPFAATQMYPTCAASYLAYFNIGWELLLKGGLVPYFASAPKI